MLDPPFLFSDEALSPDDEDAMETVNRFLETYHGGQIKIPEDILPNFDPSRAQDSTAPRQLEFHLGENK
jgi:hypothetical protein